MGTLRIYRSIRAKCRSTTPSQLGYSAVVVTASRQGSGTTSTATIALGAGTSGGAFSLKLGNGTTTQLTAAATYQGNALSIVVTNAR